MMLGIVAPGVAGPCLAGDVAAVPQVSTLVQFRSFLVPAQQTGPVRAQKTGKRKSNLKAVTVIVEVGAAEADAVCDNLPRIRDAVLVELFREPLALDGEMGGHVDTAGARLLAPMNRALGGTTVRRVYVINGPENVAEATAAQLPFSRMVGCRKPRNRKA